jgi:hypothetical protein
MMRLWRYLPLKVIFLRLWKKFLVRDDSSYWAEKDRRGEGAIPMQALEVSAWSEPGTDLDILKSYRRNQFNILGTGWITWTEEHVEVSGFEGEKYTYSAPEKTPEQFEANNIDLDEKFGFQSKIDWQRDMRSGFRFPLLDSAFNWGNYNSMRGVDVKVCWEIGRLQHLPRMAWFSKEPETDFENFKATVIDFWRNNPPGLGVQWGCAMDVAIRAVNLVLTQMIWKDRGQSDNDFDILMDRIIPWHARFIMRHAEKKEGLSNNHFLFNLAGLVFCAFDRNPENEEVSNWIDFAHKHLEEQTMRQFFEDGGNFEGSLSYHFFSLECVLWSWNILSNWSRKPSKSVEERLCRAIQLAEDAMLPDGSAPQIGDNDSGAMIRIAHKNDGVSEDLLNRAALIDLFYAAQGNEPQFPEAKIFAKIGLWRVQECERKDLALFESSPMYLPDHSREFSFQWTAEEGGLNFYAYPDFGLYIWKNSKDFIGIYLPIKKGHPSRGHRHADDGHIELWLNGSPIWRDPGSYCYTAAPEWRNRFRSAEAHRTPFTGITDLDDDGVFYLRDQVRTNILALQPDRLLVEFRLKRMKFYREIWFQGADLLITDHADKEWSEMNFPYFSPSYGRKIEL